jgi:hypothetical protein
MVLIAHLLYIVYVCIMYTILYAVLSHVQYIVLHSILQFTFLLLNNKQVS